MIRNKEGLFSSGKANPTWSKKGKTWTSKLSIQAHFALFNNEYYKDLDKVYKDCELVEFELTPIKTTDMNHFAKMRKFYSELNQKHRGLEIGSMAEKLLEEDRLEEFRYAVGVWDSVMDDAFELLKRLGIKKNQYRSRNRCLAFASGDDAALFRLTYSGNTESYDLVELVPIVRK